MGWRVGAMADVVERATFERGVQLHAALGVAAVPLCFSLALFCRSAPFQSVPMYIWKTSKTIFFLCAIAGTAASIALAVMNNSAHGVPHIATVHSHLAIATMCFITARVIFEAVINIVGQKLRRPLPRPLFATVNILLRISIIAFAIATIFTGIMVRRSAGQTAPVSRAGPLLTSCHAPV